MPSLKVTTASLQADLDRHKHKIIKAVDKIYSVMDRDYAELSSTRKRQFDVPVNPHVGLRYVLECFCIA